MSDVSKTNELIGSLNRVAGLLEEYAFENNASEAPGLMRQAADALEAATREPNDDRTPEFEAIEQELFKHQPVLSMQDGSIRGCKCMDRVFMIKTEDWGTHLAEVFEHQLSRATVPDAATEELAQAKSDMKTVTEIFRNVFDNTRAERAAALAAIERVRAIHAPLSSLTWGAPEEFQVCEECNDPDARDFIYWPCPTVTALDGAPEPKVEELPETGLEVRDSDGDLIMSGEHRKVLHQGMCVCDSCVNDLGLNVRWDRAGFMEGHPFPVEGESNDA